MFDLSQKAIERAIGALFFIGVGIGCALVLLVPVLWNFIKPFIHELSR